MTYTLPVFMEGSLMIGDVPVDFHRLIMMVIGILLVAGLWVFTHHTRIGLALQGMAQDERAALMLGIDSDFMAMLAMGFGAVLAGVAATLILPLGNIGRFFCRFYHRVCPNPDCCLYRIAFSNGGGPSGHYPDPDPKTVRLVRPTKRTGREGVKK